MKEIRINWKKALLVVADLGLMAYLAVAMGHLNTPDQTDITCKEVGITISDQSKCGFLSAKEVKNILTRNKVYPKGQTLNDINPRDIENVLKKSSLIYDVECHKTPHGFVGINVMQRLPVIRVKSDSGRDNYLDASGNEMSNEHYTSDLIVATGHISKTFARDYLSIVGQYMINHEFWNNQIEQINVLNDKSIEIVPRIGDHVVCLGQLPESADSVKRVKNVNEFLDRKLSRLDKFYRYGLNLSGWNKYDYINLEFDNQIICRKRHQKTTIPT